MQDKGGDIQSNHREKTVPTDKLVLIVVWRSEGSELTKTFLQRARVGNKGLSCVKESKA